MSIDRLKDLNLPTPVEEKNEQVKINTDIIAFDSIKTQLNDIKKNVESIKNNLFDLKRTIKEDLRKKIINLFENTVCETNEKIKKVKSILENLKKSPNGRKSKITQNLYNHYYKKLFDLTTEYNKLSTEFKQEIQNNMKKYLTYAGLSDKEVEKVMDSGQSLDVVLKKVLISDNVKDIVASIEERHLDILKLERNVLEVFELFKDMASLVDLQEEKIHSIENNILKARNHVEKGEGELVEGEKNQKKYRKCLCGCTICLLIVLLVVLLPVILIKFKSS